MTIIIRSLRSFVATLLATATLCIALPSHNLLAQCDTAGTTFAGGAGTAESPFQISTIAHLNAIRDNSGDTPAGCNYLAKHFVLTTDLDFASYVYDTNADENAKGWLPIGHDLDSSNNSFEGTAFTGLFKGGGYVIHNLKINRPDEDFIGLFGKVGGSVDSLGMEGVRIVGGGNVGGLFGLFGGGSASNCYTTGVVSGTSNRAGGMVGVTDEATVRNSYSSVQVRGPGNVGGLAGDLDDTNIINCYATGDVRGFAAIGGLFGGIVGGVSIVTNSYATGRVTATRTLGAGGLSGSHSFRAENCFWNTELSGQSASPKVTGLTTAQMYLKASFTNWPFDNGDEVEEATDIWTEPSEDEEHFPHLKGMKNGQVLIFAPLALPAGAAPLVLEHTFLPTTLDSATPVYASSDENVATVSVDGTTGEVMVTALAVGTTVLTISRAGDDTYSSVVVEHELEVAEPPHFGDSSIANRAFTKDTEITDLVLPMATGGAAPLTYSLAPVPAGLDFDPTIPTLSGTPTAEQAATAHTYTVTDSAEPAQTAILTFTITVNAAGTPTFPGTIDDQVYTENTVITDLVLPEAMDTGTVTYSLAPVPDGLAFDPTNRTLSGTPTTPQAATQHTYTATDDESKAVTLIFMITVLADTTAPDFAGATIVDQTYTENTEIDDLVLPVATDTGTVTYSLSPVLPSGLTPAGGVTDLATPPTISGTPDTTSATMTYTYTAKDNATTPNTQTLIFMITVLADTTAPDFGGETIDDQTYILNTAITDLVLPPATDTGIVTYSLSPALPSGLTPVGAVTDVATPPTISGMPDMTFATMTYTYTAKDNATTPNTQTLTFMITVDNLPVVSIVGGASVTEGTDAEFTLTRVGDATDTLTVMVVVTGGDGFLSGAAPSEAVFGAGDATATLSVATADDDMDEEDGTVTMTVTEAVDSYRVDAVNPSATVTIMDNDDPPAGTTLTFMGTIANQTYTENTAITSLELPEATGGMGPYMYTLVPVPAGLMFDATTRTLSGMPTATTDTATTHTYTVTDSTTDMALTESLTFMITVNEEGSPTFADTIANQTYTKDTAITALELPEATGGMGALTYSLAPVPVGLEFDAATRTLSGTPSTASTTATTHTYTVTDSATSPLTASMTFTITVNEAETTFGIGSQGAAVHVYPNPAGDVLHIEFPGAGEYGIALLTVTGQPVLGGWHAGGGTMKLDVSTLKGGVYFLKIEDSEGVSHTFRIIR